MSDCVLWWLDGYLMPVAVCSGGYLMAMMWLSDCVC
jgi:hypothetical protein